MMNSKVPMMMTMMILIIVAIVFVVQGVNKQNNVESEETAFHSLQEDYIVNNTKTERDNADSGSELLEQQAELANYPSTLLELKLVGVGKILTGISVLLGGILVALMMMPIRLGKIIKADN